MNLGDQFRGDDFELIFAHRFDGAVVRSESVIEGDFVVIQTEIDAALSRGALR
jgi:hypothetical protein